MAFALALEGDGLTAKHIDTRAAVHLAKDGDGFKIDRIALELSASIPGITEAKFQQLASGAKSGCPLSKALASVPDVTFKATLAN